MHKHLRRLPLIREQTPLYFITTCTYQRKPILAVPGVALILMEEWREALSRHGWKTGRYVIMPDHVHFFCSVSEETAKSLPRFMQAWKQWTSKRLVCECDLSSPVWQAGFFDHLLRSSESAMQKWEYVIENPVRASLVERSKDWPWQGEIFPFEMQL